MEVDNFVDMKIDKCFVIEDSNSKILTVHSLATFYDNAVEPLTSSALCFVTIVTNNYEFYSYFMINHNLLK